MNGYMGKILRVNLSTKEVAREDLNSEIAAKFVGGRGLAAKYLFDELRKGIDPFSPENKVVLATNPFAGTIFPGGSRLIVAAKSPLTELLGDTDLGGYFGPEMKACGYDAIIVEGKAEKPVYLWIHNHTVEIKDATHLWGRITGETQQEILKEVKDEKAKVLSIGPAGEKLVRYANLVSELDYFGGRMGLGAVLGSKNLKTVVVRGNQKVEVADESGLKEIVRSLNKDTAENTNCQIFGKYGTWGAIATTHLNGVTPVKNFQLGTFEETNKIDGDALLSSIFVGRKTCHHCPLACRRVIEVKDPLSVSKDYGGPQYETVASFGPLLLISDKVAIAKANELCNKYGLDTISTGVCIAFVLECFEKKVLNEKDIGFELKWGDGEALFKMIEMITYRKGVGDVLAEGVKRAAEKIDKGSEKWAVHVKGLEVAMHDPRGKKGMGLSYATCHKGGDHMETFHDEPFEKENLRPELGLVEAIPRKEIRGKPRFVKIGQDYWGTLGDTLAFCKLMAVPVRSLTPKYLLDAFNAVTGRNLTLPELLTIGERVFNLCRVFNVREGVSRKDDVLPERLEETLREGGSAGESFSKRDLEMMLAEYYQLRGWDENGIPRLEALRRLGLEDVINKMRS